MASSTATTNKESLNNTMDKEDYGTILYLLHAKVHGDPLPNESPLAVHCCDLYGQKNPWEIWESFGGGKNGANEIYLFTIIKMNMKTLDVVRNIGLGFWEDQRNDVAIVCKETQQHLATKKCLLFNKSGTSQDTAWILHEYRLVAFDFLGKPNPNFHRSSSANFSYVLCKLLKNRGSRIQLGIPNEIVTKQVMIDRPIHSLSQWTNATANNNNNSCGLMRQIMSQQKGARMDSLKKREEDDNIRRI